MASYRSGRIDIRKGDITQLDVDAIVNAANQSLLGGGGVDGAIHRAAGPKLLEACRELGGAETGEAKITDGFDLKARHVVHAVGPRWRGGDRGERELLEAAYHNSLRLARDHALGSVAFPSISTGAYGFPIDEAAEIALRTIDAFVANHDDPETVILCAFSEADREVYDATAARILS